MAFVVSRNNCEKLSGSIGLVQKIDIIFQIKTILPSVSVRFSLTLRHSRASFNWPHCICRLMLCPLMTDEIHKIRKYILMVIFCHFYFSLKNWGYQNPTRLTLFWTEFKVSVFSKVSSGSPLSSYILSIKLNGSYFSPKCIFLFLAKSISDKCSLIIST